MENATKALIMAFAFLIFAAALFLSISSFERARAVSDSLIQMSDSSYDYTFVKPQGTIYQLDGKNLGSVRTVGAETIIPTLYRAYKENFIIIFEDDGNGIFSQRGIFAQRNMKEQIDSSNRVLAVAGAWNNTNLNNENMIQNNTIDLQALNLGSEKKAIDFIRCLLYGTTSDDLLFNKFNINGSQLYKNLLNNNLYGIINNNKFKELLGEYYLEDEIAQENSEPDEDYTTSQISDNNKTRRRIITYKLEI